MLKPNNRSVHVRVEHVTSCDVYYNNKPHAVECISCVGGNSVQLVLVVSILAYHNEAGCCDVYLCSTG